MFDRVDRQRSDHGPAFWRHTSSSATNSLPGQLGKRLERVTMQGKSGKAQERIRATIHTQREFILSTAELKLEQRSHYVEIDENGENVLNNGGNGS